MMSAKISGFWTLSPLSSFWIDLNSRKIPYCMSAVGLTPKPLPPSVWTSFMDGLLQLHEQPCIL